MISLLGPASTTLASASGDNAARDAVNPTAPSGLNVRASNSNAFVLEWQRSTESVKGYLVYIERVVVGTTPLTKFAVTNLNCNQTYKVAVVAVGHGRKPFAPSIRLRAYVAVRCCATAPTTKAAAPSNGAAAAFTEAATASTGAAVASTEAAEAA